MSFYDPSQPTDSPEGTPRGDGPASHNPPLPTSQYTETPPPPLPPAINFRIKSSHSLATRKGNSDRLSALNTYDDDNNGPESVPRKFPINIKPPTAFSENGIIVRPLAINSLSNVEEAEDDVSNTSASNVNASVESKSKQDIPNDEPKGDSPEIEVNALKTFENEAKPEKEGSPVSPRISKKESRRKDERRSRKRSKDRSRRNNDHYEDEENYKRSFLRESPLRNRSMSSDRHERESSEIHRKSSKKKKHHEKSHKKHSDRKSKKLSRKRTRSSRSRSERKRDKAKKTKKDKRSKHSPDDSKRRNTEKVLTDEILDLKKLLDDDFVKSEPYKSAKSSKKRDKKNGDKLPKFDDKVPEDVNASSFNKEDPTDFSDSVSRSKKLTKNERNKMERSIGDTQLTLDELEITIVNDRIKQESMSKKKKVEDDVRSSVSESKTESMEKLDGKGRRKRKIEGDKVIVENFDNEKSRKDSKYSSERDTNATEKNNKIEKSSSKLRGDEPTEKISDLDNSQNGEFLLQELPKAEMDYDLVFMSATDVKEVELRKPVVEEKRSESEKGEAKSLRDSLSFVPKQVKHRQKLDFVANVRNHSIESLESSEVSRNSSQTEQPKVEESKDATDSKSKILNTNNCQSELTAEEVITQKKASDSESNRNDAKISSSSVIQRKDSDKYNKDFSLSEISESSPERGVEKIRQGNEVNLNPETKESMCFKDVGIEDKEVSEMKVEMKSESDRSSAKKESSGKRPNGDLARKSSKYHEDANSSKKQPDNQKRKKESSPSLRTKRSQSPKKIPKESKKNDEKAPTNRNTAKYKNENQQSRQNKTSSDRNRVLTKSTSKEESNSRSESYRKESSLKYSNSARKYNRTRSRSRSSSYNSYKRLRRDLSRSRTNERSPVGRKKPDASSRNHRDVPWNNDNHREMDSSYSNNGVESRSSNRVQSSRYYDFKSNQQDRGHDRNRKRGSYKRHRSYSSSDASSFSSVESRKSEVHQVLAKRQVPDRCLNMSGLENICSQSTGGENTGSVKVEKAQEIIGPKSSIIEEQSKVSKQHQEDPQWTAVTELCPIKSVVTSDPNRGEPIHSIVTQPTPSIPMNFIPNVLPTVVAEELSGSKAVKKIVDEKVQCWSDSKKVSIDQWLERSATVPTFNPSQFPGLQNQAQRLNQPISSLPAPPPTIIPPPNFAAFVAGGPNAPATPTLPFPMPPFIPSFLPPPQFISSLDPSMKSGSTAFLPAGIPCEKQREESERNLSSKMSLEESNKLCAELEKMKNSRAASNCNNNQKNNSCSNQKSELAPPLPPLPIDQSAGFQQLVQSILPDQQPLGVTSSKGLMSTSFGTSGVVTSVVSKPPPTPPPSEPLKPKTPPPMPSPSYSPSLSPVEKKPKKSTTPKKESQGNASVTKSSDHGKSPVVSKTTEPSPGTVANNTMQGTLQNLQELLLNIKGVSNVASTVEPNLRVSPAAVGNKRKSAFDMGEEVMVPLGLELSEFTPPRMGEDDSPPTNSNTEKLKDLEKLFPPTALSTASSQSPVKKLTEVKLSSSAKVKSSSSGGDHQKKQFQDKVAAYAKKHLKPHFVKGRVSKDQYKHIMRRVVGKCTEGVKSYDVKQEKIRKLVESYVSHIQTKAGPKQ